MVLTLTEFFRQLPASALAPRQRQTKPQQKKHQQQTTHAGNLPNLAPHSDGFCKSSFFSFLLLYTLLRLGVNPSPVSHNPTLATPPSTPPKPPGGNGRSKQLKRLLRYGLLRLSQWALATLPLRWASALGAGLGWLASFLLFGEFKKALASLAVAFPENTPAQNRRLARACFTHLGRTACELACIRQIDANLEAWVEWPPEARQLLEEARQEGRGVIFVSGHVGNWELLARRVAMAGIPCASIAKATTDLRTTRWIEQFRAQGKLVSIWRESPSASRQMLQTLRNNGVLGLLIDQDTRVQSLFVPFFGKLAKTPRAAADLALLSQAPLVVGFCQRMPSGRYRLSMRRIPAPTQRSYAAALELTASLSQEIETAIRQTPEQWVWMHQRWKTPPPEAEEEREGKELDEKKKVSYT